MSIRHESQPITDSSIRRAHEEYGYQGEVVPENKEMYHGSDDPRARAEAAIQRNGGQYWLSDINSY